MDVVSDMLQVSGVRGALGAWIDDAGEWAAAFGDQAGAALHVVVEGAATLRRPGHPPLDLAAGDVVLLPEGARHRLNGRGSRLITMHYDCDHTARTQVIDALPDLIHVRGGRGDDGFDDTVRLLGRELTRPGIAGTAMLNNLVDIMLIQLLRAAPLKGFLGMLHDPVVNRALERIHTEPGRQWTTTSLAAEIAVSRATLARRFPVALGLSPAAYLTQWRMDLAAMRLRRTGDSVESIAAAVGYGSVPAFSRAFTRARGLTPGRFRSRVRAAT
ncbi:AraC family transcriptional regulator [Actinoplanes couchii]|uniref:AraC family transcriptional regulator n=1 Tax=Actinoplanes couchii TaxID=403638 RepID=A0ABQ3XKE8_9ACTN|nr:AraC family transcriptional regulator [Actinoplanes couchii]MDR6320573.1 AraC-like DNA-binding protein [Actinoplanes couchii]GID58976.1 AraC family transcriptional regulator [Actinoplanes couchii]